MAVTLNPADKGSDVTLSGGDLTASLTASSHDMVRATAAKSSGSYYWEVTLADSGTVFGVTNATETMDPGGGATTLGQTVNSAGSSGPSTGDFVFNNSIIFAAGTHVAADVWGFALNMGARTLAVYRNNVLQGTATSVQLPAGNLYAAIGGGGGGSVMGGTINFGATAFTYTPPVGFIAYDGSFTHSMTGGIGIGGIAVVYPSVRISHEILGGIGVGGAATIFSHSAYIHAMTGGLGIGGVADIGYSQATVYRLSDEGVPSGGMKMGGAALVQEVIKYLPTGGMKMSGSANIYDRIPYITSGGMVMAGVADVVFVAVHTPTGGMQMAGAATVVNVSTHTASSGMKMGGTAFVDTRSPYFAASGGMKMGGAAVAYMLTSGMVATTENPLGEPFPGWAINLDNFTASRYMGLPANSMTQFGGESFVANAGGIYKVGADDDAGQPIKASIQFPTTDYSVSRDKYMETAYIGVRTTGKMRLKVMVNKQAPLYYPIAVKSDSLKGTRIVIGKGMKGRYWGFRLDNVNGADFELESAEFIPVAGQRHGA